MLLLQTIPISKKLHEISAEQSSRAPQPANCNSADYAAGAGYSPVLEQSLIQSPAAADQPHKPTSRGGVSEQGNGDTLRPTDGASPPPDEASPPSDDSAAEADSSMPVLWQQMAGMTRNEAAADPAAEGSHNSIMLPPLNDDWRSVITSPQCSQSSEEAKSAPYWSEEVPGQEKPAAEASRQRYKLSRYFQALDPACSPEVSCGNPGADHQLVSNSSVPPVPGHGVTVSSPHPVHSASPGGRHSTTVSSASPVTYPEPTAYTGSEGALRSIGYAGFVGVHPSASGCSVGGVGYTSSADFACLRASERVTSRRNRAPRVGRGAIQPRQPLIGGAGMRPVGVTLGCGTTHIFSSGPVSTDAFPAEASPITTQMFAVIQAHSTRPGFRTGIGSVSTPGNRPVIRASGSDRQWSVPSGEEQALRAEAFRRSLAAGLPTEMLTPSAAWHQDFDDLMRQCRGDQPLPPRAGRLRHRQSAPSRETLRHLRERVCLGCIRAFPDSNYFDVYYHVNTVYRWFNWSLDV